MVGMQKPNRKKSGFVIQAYNHEDKALKEYLQQITEAGTLRYQLRLG